MRNSVHTYTGGLLIGALFVLSAYATHTYTVELEALLKGYGVLGPIAYVSLSALSVVLAPLNTLFLLPMASMLWGPLWAATLSVLGWTIGSVAAYGLAQRYGKPFVGKFVDLKKVERLEKKLPAHHLFWWVVAMRMVVSVDVLSYLLGLSITMSYARYTAATLIGVTPFAFVFAYASALPLPYMLAATSLALLATGSGAYALLRSK